MCDTLDAVVPDIPLSVLQAVSEQERDAARLRVAEAVRHFLLYLAPRYTFKTSLCEAFMAFVVLKFREQGYDVSIDYVRAAYEDAIGVLYELKMNLTTLPFITELWGNLEAQANLWAESKINLGRRRDPTISAYGMNKGTAGRHPDLVITDDLVNEKNYDSPPAKRKARGKIQAYLPVLPPWGVMIVPGTRFANDDTYGWILSENENNARKNKKLIDEALALPDGPARRRKLEEASAARPKWTEYIRAVYDKAGNPFFPDKLTVRFLDEQREMLEPRLYAAWYLNSTSAEGMVHFQKSYLQYFSFTYQHYPVPLLQIASNDDLRTTVDEVPVRITMTLDPTLTATGYSDWTGMSMVATDAEGFWWVLFSTHYLEVPSRIGEIALAHIRKYKPAVLRIESAMADVEMVSRIQRGLQDEHLPTVIESYNPNRDEAASGTTRRAVSARSKAARIQALEPRFRGRRIALARGACEALYDQYRNWPDVEHDDVFDSLAMQVGLAKPCQYRTLRDAEVKMLLEEDTERPDDFWKGYVEGAMAERKMGRAGASSQRLRTG